MLIVYDKFVEARRTVRTIMRAPVLTVKRNVRQHSGPMLSYAVMPKVKPHETSTLIEMLFRINKTPSKLPRVILLFLLKI